MLSPRRMSVASVPFVAASRASSDANRTPSVRGALDGGRGFHLDVRGDEVSLARARVGGGAEAAGAEGRGADDVGCGGGEVGGGGVVGGGAVGGRLAQTARGVVRRDEREHHRAQDRGDGGPSPHAASVRGVSPRGGRGSVSSATSPSRVHRLRAGRATGAALDASSAREDADVSRAYPSAPPRGRTISMDAITNRRTTPASRARASLLTPDGTAGGWTMRGFRCVPRGRARDAKITSEEPLSTDASSRRSRRQTSEGWTMRTPGAPRAATPSLGARVSRLISNPARRPVRAERSAATTKRALSSSTFPSL